MPAIHQGNRHSQQSPMMQQPHKVPTPPSQGKPGSAKVYVIGSKKRTHGKKERELEQRKATLRAQQPDLAKSETSSYRNTYKHNLCLDMLQDGFHKSYSELFALIQQQNNERENAGPESVLWNQLLLENEPEKLDTLKAYLTRAEQASRRDNFGDMYQCQFQLARYFQSTGDKWLADHFFSSCLHTSRQVKGDEGRMSAEGHCNVGLALEESGDYFQAMENFEKFFDIAKDKPDWSIEEGLTMHSTSCTNLARIYTTIAKGFETDGDLEQYLYYLKRAYDMAKESGDKKLEGDAAYRLGVAFEKNEDPDTALLYLNGYLDSCRTLDDNEGIGKACEAIAKAFERQGKVEESIKYLEMFVEVAEKSKDDKAISRACSNLGAMFNSLGRYDQAVEYFNKAYNIARAMNDTETISSSRVLFGVAAAHKMLQNFATHVEISTRPCMERLIEWKDNRGDEFDKEVAKPEEETKSEAAKEEK